jgi:hypothetical protein
MAVKVHFTEGTYLRARNWKRFLSYINQPIMHEIGVPSFGLALTPSDSSHYERQTDQRGHDEH